jgi:hypothetical protein
MDFGGSSPLFPVGTLTPFLTHPADLTDGAALSAVNMTGDRLNERFGCPTDGFGRR